MLIVMSMIFPLLQLVVLGYAFGGNVKHLRLAIVDQDHGVPAVKMRELAGAVSAGARTLVVLGPEAGLRLGPAEGPRVGCRDPFVCSVPFEAAGRVSGV